MPTSLARLFARGRSSRRDDRAYGLRLAAGLLESRQPRRVLEAACRLARRATPCDLALVAAWPRDGAASKNLELIAGRVPGGQDRALLEALAGRHSPVQDLLGQPRWIHLDADPFQPGTPLLRRFDLKWALALPFLAEIDDEPRSCVVLLAGRRPEMEPSHALIRDARLVWLAVRSRLATAPEAVDPAATVWPDQEGWETAPAALALVTHDRVLAVNQKARALLSESIGRDGHHWEPWLLGAVQRLDLAGQEREILTASQSKGRRLEVTLTADTDQRQPRLVCLHEVSTADHDDAEHEATMRVLGHELRTPLTAMRTSLDLVLRGDTGALTDDQERFLGTARRNLERLNRLLSDLLDAKRAEAGRLAINPATVDLGALLRDDLQMLAVTCREKGISLDYDGVPASFRACLDADKVQQMLHNLASNAIKYTGEGGLVRVWLQDRPERTPGTGARLARRFELPLDVFTLVVEDSGMGMSEEFLEHLFQPFYRDNRVETRRLPGAGLGLHITKGLAEAHGGEIRLTSQPGQGTSAWLVLPREPGSAQVLTAGRQLDQLREAAQLIGLDAAAVVLDIRHHLSRAHPWEVESAGEQGQRFLSELARSSRQAEAGRVQRAAGQICWQLAAGLWVGLALDPDRLAPAWQVAVAAPESSPLLVGTNWQILEDSVSVVDAEATARMGSTPVTGGP